MTMRPPFVLWIRDEDMADVFASAEELVAYVESPDVDDDNYAAFDSEGRLLELIVDRSGPLRRSKRFGWVAIEPVILRAGEPEPAHQEKLRRLLMRTLAVHGREPSELSGL
jgi:hypothetical protein